MLKNMMGSPIAWGILSLIAVFSLLFAIYTWIVGKKKKQVSIVCETNEVIASGKSKIEKLYIQYDGEEIDNLSVTKFYIWNSGNEVINNTDILFVLDCSPDISSHSVLSLSLSQFLNYPD